MAKTSVCIKCMREVTYIERNIPISYSINGKEQKLINGYDRVCSVCGFGVDTPDVFEENKRRYENNNIYIANTAPAATETTTIIEEYPENLNKKEEYEFLMTDNGQMSLF